MNWNILNLRTSSEITTTVFAVLHNHLGTNGNGSSPAEMAQWVPIQMEQVGTAQCFEVEDFSSKKLGALNGALVGKYP